MPSPFVPESARNISTQADFILVERTINQNIEALLFWYFQGNRQIHGAFVPERVLLPKTPGALFVAALFAVGPPLEMTFPRALATLVS